MTNASAIDRKARTKRAGKKRKQAPEAGAPEQLEFDFYLEVLTNDSTKECSSKQAHPGR